MFEEIKNVEKGLDDERGMVGIGTLIVFIAMVITAAVAAGVLIQTSGTLQQQARATGKETITEVSSGLEVVAAKGITDSDNKIDNVKLVVQAYPGSKGIDLENTVIQVKTDENMVHLYNANTDSLDNYGTENNQFLVSKEMNVSDTRATMVGEGDTVVITINFYDNAADNTEVGSDPGLSDDLGPSDTASVQIIPSRGFKTYYGLMAPATMSKTEWYEL